MQTEYTEHFPFLILKILELFSRKLIIFLKKDANFNVFYNFCMFINKHFTSFRVNNLKTLGIKNAKFPGYYFHMNTNIYGDSYMDKSALV